LFETDTDGTFSANTRQFSGGPGTKQIALLTRAAVATEKIA
jgi:hypothetical protein